MKNLKTGGFQSSRISEFYSNLSASKLFAISLLILGGIANILSSAKLHIGLFAWVGPLLFLYYFRISRIKRKILWFFLTFIISSIISSKDVAPFPLPLLVIVGLIQTFKTSLVYLSDKWITKKSDHFLTTLFFPAASVSLEFINASLGSGVWFSLANSQFSFPWITQLASLTGLWGISFITYWFGSTIVWAIKRNMDSGRARRGIIVYAVVFVSVILFGSIRYNTEAIRPSEQVRVAGLSVPLTGVLENIYKDYCGKSVSIDPKWSITSSKFHEIQKAELPFIETGDSLRFKYAFAAIQKANDSLFTLSEKVAAGGAKIIVWSEANALVFKKDEKQLIERGQEFSKGKKVYLLMAIASIHPGKILASTKFLENEAVFISPKGEILHVFHKNNPVPLVEASEPGDGNIPVISTPFGRIATSICYDADFPIQMRQLGEKKADFLLLPSGDWNAISPYHSYMAAFRGIENGTAIVRQVSGGLSILADYKGRILASQDFYQQGEKCWFADLPIRHVNTIYSKIGDSFAWICLGLTLIGLIYTAVKTIRKRFNQS